MIMEALATLPTRSICGTAINGTIITGGDLDFFRIDLEGKGELKAWTTGSTDTFGVLLNSNCSEITQQDSGGPGENFLIDQKSLSAGTYYIEVRHSDIVNGTGDYQLNVSCTLTYDIYAEALFGGIITPSGTVPLALGGSQTFIVTATGGNTILEVKVDDVVQSAATGKTSYTYTFTNVTKSHSIVATFNLPSSACVDISDIPLDARFQAAPANIMFLLDDSGSMNWEFLTKEDDGIFHPGGTSNFLLCL